MGTWGHKPLVHNTLLKRSALDAGGALVSGDPPRTLPRQLRREGWTLRARRPHAVSRWKRGCVRFASVKGGTHPWSVRSGSADRGHHCLPSCPLFPLGPRTGVPESAWLRAPRLSSGHQGALRGPCATRGNVPTDTLACARVCMCACECGPCLQTGEIARNRLNVQQRELARNHIRRDSPSHALAERSSVWFQVRRNDRGRVCVGTVWEDAC